MEEDWARELQAIVPRLALKTTATGTLSAPCLPILFDYYWAKILRLFEAIDRPLSGDQLTQFKDAFRRVIQRGAETSPYAQFILSYRPAGTDGGEVECNLSLAVPTLEQEYQRWVNNNAAPDQLFGKNADAKVIDLATVLAGTREGPEGPAPRVLDVGAGHGRNALALAGLGLEVDAIEPVAGLAEALTGQAARLGVAVNVIQGDVLQPDLALPDGHYSLIVLAEVATHFSYAQLAEALRKLARSLTPDGTLLFNAFLSRDGYRPSPVAVEVAQAVWSTFFSRQALAGLAELAGLRLVKAEPCVAYEEARQPPDEWPPTSWYPFWARGHNLFDRAAGPSPIELYWLEYRRS